MEFMIADDVGLCRSDEFADSSLMVGGVWGFNGYAYGAFHGFESGKRVSEQEALKYILEDEDLTEHNLSEEEAKKILYAPAMEKKETIDYLVKAAGWTRKEAMDAIGVSTYDD